MVNEINAYVKTWENRCYKNGIPDELPEDLERNKLAPSYKQIAIAVLKNDHSLKSLGFTPKESKYYHILKRIEISSRDKQLQLKLL